MGFVQPPYFYTPWVWAVYIRWEIVKAIEIRKWIIVL